MLNDVLKVNEQTIQIDHEGFLLEPSDWNEDVAKAYAALEDVNELTEEHWTAINYLRSYYLENGISLEPVWLHYQVVEEASCTYRQSRKQTF